MIGGNAEFLTSKDRRPLKNKMEHEMALLLTDKTFVEFYKNSRKDRKYLFDKVAANDLVEFSQKVFSKVDVLKCLYVQAYIKKRGITRQKFKDEILSYIKANKDRKDLKPLKNDKDSIRKYSVMYIEDPAVKHIYIDEKDKIVQFESFRPQKSKDLSQIFIYAFKDKGIMRKLKVIHLMLLKQC